MGVELVAIKLGLPLEQIEADFALQGCLPCPPVLPAWASCIITWVDDADADSFCVV